jgi:G3E family GTPase
MGSRASRIPVTMLTGFLGSGKTTLLNSAMRDLRLRGTAVVVNELGEIGLDHLLVAGSAENVALLESGCICCGVLNSLRDTLLDLLAGSLAGRLPRFDRVVVETTGLADPAPAIQSILRDGLLRDFRYEGLVTTVDAVHGERSLAEHPEAIAQVALADRLVVTKTDLTCDEVPQPLRARLLELNPAAASALATRGDDAALLGPLPQFAAPFASLPAPACARHGPGIRSEAFPIDAPVGWPGLAAWIELARAEFGPALLRCKGLLRVEGEARPVVVQGVQGLFAPPRPLEAELPVPPASFLVCIHRGIDPARLRASLGVLQSSS